MSNPESKLPDQQTDEPVVDCAEPGIEADESLDALPTEDPPENIPEPSSVPTSTTPDKPTKIPTESSETPDEKTIGIEDSPEKQTDTENPEETPAGADNPDAPSSEAEERQAESKWAALPSRIKFLILLTVTCFVAGAIVVILGIVNGAVYAPFAASYVHIIVAGSLQLASGLFILLSLTCFRSRQTPHFLFIIFAIVLTIWSFVLLLLHLHSRPFTIKAQERNWILYFLDYADSLERIQKFGSGDRTPVSAIASADYALYITAFVLSTLVAGFAAFNIFVNAPKIWMLYTAWYLPPLLSIFLGTYSWCFAVTKGYVIICLLVTLGSSIALAIILMIHNFVQGNPKFSGCSEGDDVREQTPDEVEGDMTCTTFHWIAPILVCMPVALVMIALVVDGAHAASSEAGSELLSRMDYGEMEQMTKSITAFASKFPSYTLFGNDEPIDYTNGPENVRFILLTGQQNARGSRLLLPSILAMALGALYASPFIVAIALVLAYIAYRIAIVVLACLCWLASDDGPKGTCSGCGAVNSKYASTCSSCGATFV